MALAVALRTKVTGLIELDLRRNVFEDAGVTALADALRFNCSLQRLYGVHFLPQVLSGVFRLSDAEIRSCGVMEGEQHSDDVVDNAGLFKALRQKREFMRLRHELNKEVVWGDEKL